MALIEINWDFILGSIIIIGFILLIYSKLTHRTIPEVIAGIKEFIIEMKGGDES